MQVGEALVWSRRGSATISPEAPKPLIWFGLPGGPQHAIGCLAARGASSPHSS